MLKHITSYIMCTFTRSRALSKHQLECMKMDVNVVLSRPLESGIGSDLSISQVLKYFKNPGVIQTHPPLKPKAGEVCLVSWKEDCSKGNNEKYFRIRK